MPETLPDWLRLHAEIWDAKACDDTAQKCREAADRIEQLEVAIREHHDQKADDRCWLDDMELYQAAGLPLHDPHVGDPEEMLKNCKRFIDKRCLGGRWKSYAELEAENAALRAKLNPEWLDRPDGEGWWHYDLGYESGFTQVWNHGGELVIWRGRVDAFPGRWSRHHSRSNDMTTAREIDASTVNEWLAVNLFGLRKHEIPTSVNPPGYRPVGWYSKNGVFVSSFEKFDPLNDANADALVREKVRGMVRDDRYPIEQRLSIERSICDLWRVRRSDSPYHGELAVYELPGDWTKACYFVLAKHNFKSVVELDEALKA